MPVPDEKNMFSGGIAPLYYFHGDNVRACDEALARVRQHLFGDAGADFDCERFDAQVHAPAAVLMAARTMPLCSDRRLVVVQRVDAWNDDDLLKCESYCARPSSATCLVFVGSTEKKKLSGWLKKKGRVYGFANPQWDRDVRSFIRQELARHKKNASAPALDLLCQELNGNAQTMAGEIEKLALFCLECTTIEEADVEQALSAGHRNTIFTLVDAVGEARLEPALVCLRQLLDDGMPALQVLGMIVRQFRLLARVCGHGPQCLETGVIRRILKLKSDFVAKKINKQAGNWSAACLGAVFEELSSADLQLKSSRKDKGLILEHLLLRLCGLGR